MESKVAALGSTDFVMPFKALGIDTWPVEPDAESVRSAARSIVDEQYGLVVVAENIAHMADEVFARFVVSPVPCVMVMPFTTESKGFAIESLGKALKIATGIDILKHG